MAWLFFLFFFQADHYYVGQKLHKTDKHVSIVVFLLLLLLPVIQLCRMIEIQILATHNLQ